MIEEERKRYIALQKELMQKRVDTMELREEKAMESEEEHIINDRTWRTAVQTMYVYV